MSEVAECFINKIILFLSDILAETLTLRILRKQQDTSLCNWESCTGNNPVWGLAGNSFAQSEEQPRVWTSPTTDPAPLGELVPNWFRINAPTDLRWTGTTDAAFYSLGDVKQSMWEEEIIDVLLLYRLRNGQSRFCNFKFTFLLFLNLIW